MKQEGFTLIEMLLGLIVTSFLAQLAVPGLVGDEEVDIDRFPVLAVAQCDRGTTAEVAARLRQQVRIESIEDNGDL